MKIVGIFGITYLDILGISHYKKKRDHKQHRPFSAVIHNNRYTSLQNHGSEKTFKDYHKKTSFAYEIHLFTYKRISSLF